MVSFIIVNFNNSDICIKCVSSVVSHLPQGSYEIIVVDNGSCQEDRIKLQQIDRRYCHVVYERQNLGFGEGNQRGAGLAKGDYLCFLNSDAMLVEDCITPLCRYLDEHPDVGAITPVQCQADGHRTRSFRHDAGIAHLLVGDHLREMLFPHIYPDRDTAIGEGRPPVRVMQINGAFMLFPTWKFWAIGGFDTNLFLYYEEYDLGKRLSYCGWSCIVHPQYTFVHLGGASASKIARPVMRERFISQLYVYRKYHHPVMAFLFQYLLVLQVCFKPKKWHLLPLLVKGNILSQSMRFRNSI